MKNSSSFTNRKFSISRLIGLLAIVLVATVFINALPTLSVKAELLPVVFGGYGFETVADLIDKNVNNNQTNPVLPTATTTALGGIAPSLGTASSFAVLAGTTVTNTGPSVVSGNLGVSPGSAVTGFPPGIVVNGVINAGNAVAAQAQSDLLVAFNDLAGQACDRVLTGMDLGGLTLGPGVNCFASSAFLTGTLTLDAQGDPNAVFIFQIGSTLITAPNSSVVVINGGNGCNVFFQVGSSATLDTGTSFIRKHPRAYEYHAKYRCEYQRRKSLGTKWCGDVG